MGILSAGRARRARRALERQLEYQQAKARFFLGREGETMGRRAAHALAVRARIEAFRPVSQTDRVLEVGCGVHGLIFFFGTDDAVGVDPLADHYSDLFPRWQEKARTIAAFGENLPFPDGSFDIVLCDNVVDHAEDPRRIVEEMVRVLRPDGLLYFTVNVHHPFYHVAASAHAAWRAVGVPFEIRPFADHTVHLTPAAARRLLDGLPLRFLSETDSVEETRRCADQLRRHAGDRLKKLFYKNALYEVIAQRLP